MSTTYDVVMVGAGILGLATVRELRRRHPGLHIAVLEKESEVGRHQSGHNSGVMHAGVYYKPGLAEGAAVRATARQLMEQYAAEHGIPYETLRQAHRRPRRERARPARGPPRARPRQRRARPARGRPRGAARDRAARRRRSRALHVPGTGHHRLRPGPRALPPSCVEARRRDPARARGHRRSERRPASTVRDAPAPARCATRHADQLRRAALRPRGPADRRRSRRADRAVPRRLLHAEARGRGTSCRGLIYPVPDPRFPFLGVHFTKRIDGEVWAGPNAVLAFAREGYRRRDVDLGDAREVLGYSGFRALARKYWRTGAAEMWRDVVEAGLREGAAALRPRGSLATSSSSARPGCAPRPLAPDGALVDDFHLAAGGLVAARPQRTVPGGDRIAGHRRDARRASGVRVRAGWLIPRSTMARSDVSVSPPESRTRGNRENRGASRPVLLP